MTNLANTNPPGCADDNGVVAGCAEPRCTCPPPAQQSALSDGAPQIRSQQNKLNGKAAELCEIKEHPRGQGHAMAGAQQLHAGASRRPLKLAHGAARSGRCRPRRRACGRRPPRRPAVLGFCTTDSKGRPEWLRPRTSLPHTQALRTPFDAPTLPPPPRRTTRRLLRGNCGMWVAGATAGRWQRPHHRTGAAPIPVAFSGEGRGGGCRQSPTRE
jgi:hypothetical protein